MSYKKLLKIIKENKEKVNTTGSHYYDWIAGIGPLKFLLCKNEYGRYASPQLILELDEEDIEYFKNKACRVIHFEKQKEMQAAIDKLSEIEKEYNNLNCK